MASQKVDDGGKILIVEDEERGSTAGYIPSYAIERESSVVASK